MSNEVTQLKHVHYPGKYEGVVGEKLTYRQELFCRHYTQNPETCLNGTLSYALTYGFDLDSLDNEFPPSINGEKTFSERRKAENSCAQMASVLLRSLKVSKRVTELFNEMFTDTVVDGELIKIIMSAPKPSDRVAAIKEYNSLKQRITKKLDLTTKGESLNVEDRNKIEKALENIA